MPAPGATRPPNRLIDATSPYLLRHAHNPVAWYPWGDEALERARREDKPIFLSIGYSACHWCHVMERESFEDEGIARLLNERFVPVKVDREERPDLDEVYMTAVHVMHGQGGWPLSVFLTPELKPFYGGTYFPPEDRWGRPGFRSVLVQLDEIYRDRREELDRAADEVAQHVARAAQPEEGAPPEPGWVEGAVQAMRGRFDEAHGGFGVAPKFPPSMGLMLLLRVHRRTGDRTLLHMVERTLDAMAAGGIHDHVGGGFARYSTDAEWHVPHFEKMLYDNALLALAYLEGWQATRRPLYERVVRRTLDFVLREMRAPDGGFRSALDADSEGEEGRFYVWTRAEVERELGEEDGRFFAELYDVRAEGNWERGLNVLRLDPEAAHQLAAPGPERERVELLCARLREARGRRVPPAPDDKVIVAWNGLLLSALARAGAALGEERFVQAAVAAAGFLLGRLRAGGRLRHAYNRGRAEVPAFLDDCTHLAQGMLDLFEVTGEARWLEAALELAGELDARFRDGETGGYLYSEPAHATPLARTRGGEDHVLPGGNSMAAHVQLRLGRLTGEDAWIDRARRVLAAHAEPLRHTAPAFPFMLCAVETLFAVPRELVVAGAAADARTRALRRVAAAAFEPHAVRVPYDPAAADAGRVRGLLPVLEGRDGPGPTAYLCSNRACREPVGEPEALARQLAARGG
jgi:uncharacterized protein YyaL (SSP411 family)